MTAALFLSELQKQLPILHESKNKTPNSCPLLPKILTYFQNSFADRISGKFATVQQNHI